jgi:hypothetical protein
MVSPLIEEQRLAKFRFAPDCMAHQTQKNDVISTRICRSNLAIKIRNGVRQDGGTRRCLTRRTVSKHYLAGVALSGEPIRKIAGVVSQYIYAERPSVFDESCEPPPLAYAH